MFITSCFFKCSNALERQSAEASQLWKDNITCLVKNHRLVAMLWIQLWLPTSITLRIFPVNSWRCSETNTLLCNYFSFDEKQRKQTQYGPNFACMRQVVNTHYSQNTCSPMSLGTACLQWHFQTEKFFPLDEQFVILPQLRDGSTVPVSLGGIRNSKISTLLLIHPGLMQPLKLLCSFPASLEKNDKVQVFLFLHMLIQKVLVRKPRGNVLFQQ